MARRISRNGRPCSCMTPAMASQPVTMPNAMLPIMGSSAPRGAMTRAGAYFAIASARMLTPPLQQ